MKKLHFLLLALLVASVSAIMFISPLKAISQKKTIQTVCAIPDNVSQVLQHSCTTCHNTGGNGMAASVWSFSSWNEYPAKKQAKKASAMCKAITKGSMPPASAGKDKKPTEAQKNIVCSWATGLNK